MDFFFHFTCLYYLVVLLSTKTKMEPFEVCLFFTQNLKTLLIAFFLTFRERAGYRQKDCLFFQLLKSFLVLISSKHNIYTFTNKQRGAGVMSLNFFANFFMISGFRTSFKNVHVVFLLRTIWNFPTLQLGRMDIAGLAGRGVKRRKILTKNKTYPI